MGRRVVMMTLLLSALVAPAAARAAEPDAQAAVAPLKVLTADRAALLRDGLTIRQAVKVPGFVSWEARLAPAPRAGRITAHQACELVTAVFTREVAAPGTVDVTLRLTPRGAKLVRARRLVRLVVTTTVMPDAGGRVTAARGITLR